MSQRALAEIGGDPQCVFVHPGDLVLGLWQGETVLDELLGNCVELPLDGGIRATARKPDHAASIVGFGAIGARPYPVLALAFS